MNPVVEAIRKKYPDAYKDLSDDQLTLAISKKFPGAYQDVEAYSSDLKRLTTPQDQVTPDQRPETGGAASAITPPQGSGARLLEPGPPALQLGQTPTQVEQAQAALATPEGQAMTQKLETPLVNIPAALVTPPATALVAPRIAQGMAQANKSMAEGMTSPAGLATLPYMALGAAEGAATQAVGPAARAIGAAFGAQGVEGLGQSAPEFVNAVKRGDVEGAAKAASETAMNALMVAGGVGALKPPGVEVPPVLEKTLLPRSAEALKESEVTSARPNETPATVHGDLLPLSTESAGQVPVQEGSARVQPQAEGRLPETQAQGAVETKPSQPSPEMPSGGTEVPTAAAEPVSSAGVVEPAGAPPVISDAAMPDPVGKFMASIESIPEGPNPPRISSQPMGITPFPAIGDALTKAAQVGKDVWNEVRSLPKFKPFAEVINAFNAKDQMASLRIRKLQADLEKRVKDPVKREAITNYLQADGDQAKLQAWEAQSKNRNRREGYKAAQNLTPDEIKVAQSIRQVYSDLLAKAQAYGIIDQGLANYVTQVWKQPLIRGMKMAEFMTKLSRNFKFARQRAFENFFEGESVGFKPVTKDISKLLGLYISELEKTIATRDMISDLTKKKASDGNPLAKPEGTATVAADSAGDPNGPMFIKPGIVKGDVRYQQIDHPALAKWKWVAKDAESGRDAFILGELRIHPEVVRHLRNILSQSQISKWMREPTQSPSLGVIKGAARAADTFGKVTKEVMLGVFSTFHHVQEGTHAVGHRINPFFPDKLPIDAPEFGDALFHGLQVGGGKAAMESFQEGLGSKDLFRELPGGKLLEPLLKRMQQHNDLLFNEYIPRLKWATYQAILRRNTARFKPELDAGRVTLDDIKYESAKQTNAAYGHLNYVDLGRNATVQHVLRIILLAPDFLEARGRFVGQAAKGMLAKGGREQLEAIAVLAGTFYVGARILNKLSTGEWNTDEPFGVRIGNRIYRMRSVPEDLWRMWNQTRRFAYGRLNPVFGRGLVELLTGKNFRGENVPASETFKDILTSWVPIQMRTLPGFKKLSETQQNTTITAWEHALGAVGIQVSRYSPSHKVYQWAKDWKKAEGIPEDRGTYPTSKYAPLRYALEDGDLERGFAEINKLRDAGMRPADIEKGFKLSMDRPFVGNAQQERRFRNSLDSDQRDLYDEALRERKRVLSEFKKAERNGSTAN